jgi:hypothetical protein
MTSETLKAQDVVTISDVRLLASASSPCITIALNIPTPLDLPVKLKSAVREVEKKLRIVPLSPTQSNHCRLRSAKLPVI